jgi:hypothetical protein
VAGLDPAIHASLWRGDTDCQDLDARNKTGQGVFLIAPTFAGSRFNVAAISKPDSRGLGPAIQPFGR